MTAWEWVREGLGLDRDLRRIEDRVGLVLTRIAVLNWRMSRMGAELDLLQTEVAETKAAVGLAVAGIADLKTKLAEAIAAGNPAALTALAADLDTLQADIAAALAPAEPPVEPPVA